MPPFQMGFKDINFETKGIKCLNREISKILLEIILGRSSSLYTELYNEGLINNTLILITVLKKIMLFLLLAVTQDPLLVKEKVVNRIKIYIKKVLIKRLSAY